MVRHCENCGKSKRHYRSTFSRGGGYKCINRDCPESPLFRFQTIKGDIMHGTIKAIRLRRCIDAEN